MLCVYCLITVLESKLHKSKDFFFFIAFYLSYLEECPVYSSRHSVNTCLMNGSSSSFPELWNAPSQIGTFFLPGVDVISKDGGNSISHLKYSSVTSTLPTSRDEVCFCCLWSWASSQWSVLINRMWQKWYCKAFQDWALEIVSIYIHSWRSSLLEGNCLLRGQPPRLLCYHEAQCSHGHREREG